MMGDTIKVSTDDLTACAVQFKNIAESLKTTCDQIVTKMGEYDAYWKGSFTKDFDKTISEFRKSSNTAYTSCTDLVDFINKAVEKYIQVDRGLIPQSEVGNADYPGNVTVPARIRYISQNPNSPDYNASYWGGYDPSSGCAVSCVSMALSSLGIDMLPKDVCNNNLKTGTNPVYMYWYNSGKCSITSGTNSLKSALEKYQSDPNKYAPPIIKLPDRQHYVVVTGINADGSYQTLDPYSGEKSYYLSSAPQIIQYYK